VQRKEEAKYSGGLQTSRIFLISQLCFTAHLLTNLQQTKEQQMIWNLPARAKIRVFIHRSQSPSQRLIKEASIIPHAKDRMSSQRLPLIFLFFSPFSSGTPKSYIEKASLEMSCNVLYDLWFFSIVKVKRRKIWTQEGERVPVTNPDFNARSSPQAVQWYFLKYILRCRITLKSETE